MFLAKKHPLNPAATDTLIGEGSLFEGKVKSEASIRIEGQVIGGVDCAGDVTVGERGVVKSDITARNLILAGTVHGNVTVTEKLTIISTGQLFGNANVQSFVIEEGGVFHGTSTMEGKNGLAADKDEDGAAKPFRQACASAPAAI